MSKVTCLVYAGIEIVMGLFNLSEVADQLINHVIVIDIRKSHYLEMHFPDHKYDLGRSTLYN